MENKIIVVASIKGGVGKSTLCCLLATYLSEAGVPVAVLDADIQQSIMHHRQLELSQEPNAKIPWQLTPLLKTSEEEMMDVVQRLKKLDGCIIVDCPGNVQDPTMKYIYNAADIAIVPFHYDCDSVDATKTFLNVFRKVSNAKVLLMPNRVVTFSQETAYDYHWKKEAEKLKDEDNTIIVTARIKDGKAVPKYSTIKNLNIYQKPAVAHAFNDVLFALDLEVPNEGKQSPK